jgi:hypothetical protein
MFGNRVGILLNELGTVHRWHQVIIVLASYLPHSEDETRFKVGFRG